MSSIGSMPILSKLDGEEDVVFDPISVLGMLGIDENDWFFFDK